MRFPAIRGVIERRILVNYRVEPQVLARLLPPPFRPKTYRGAAIAGICLIRLRDIRPSFLPLPFGMRSENAAHRMAVEWEAYGARREGVYIPRRDTDSRMNALAGGRLFPGEHHHSPFTVQETRDRISVAFASSDGNAHLTVRASPAAGLPASSVFQSLEEASEFFRAGSIGYSATSDPSRLQGLELRCQSWRVEPLAIEQVESSFFDDPARFPPGTAMFDCALIMRDIRHEWHSLEDLCCPAAVR
jgi:hypothetical protein